LILFRLRSHSWAKSILVGYVDRATHPFFQRLLDLTVFEQAADNGGVDLDKNVNVAVRAPITARSGSEYPRMAHTPALEFGTMGAHDPDELSDSGARRIREGFALSLRVFPQKSLDVVRQRAVLSPRLGTSSCGYRIIEANGDDFPHAGTCITM